MEAGQAVVAIVDDDAAVRRALRRLVLAFGHEAATFESGEAFLEGLAKVRPTHVLLDLHMRGLQGPALITRLRELTAASKMIVMTGLETPGAREACLAAGADLFLRKPIEPVGLQRILSLGGGVEA